MPKPSESSTARQDFFTNLSFTPRHTNFRAQDKTSITNLSFSSRPASARVCERGPGVRGAAAIQIILKLSMKAGASTRSRPPANRCLAAWATPPRAHLTQKHRGPLGTRLNIDLQEHRASCLRSASGLSLGFGHILCTSLTERFADEQQPHWVRRMADWFVWGPGANALRLIEVVSWLFNQLKDSRNALASGRFDSSAAF